MMKLCRNCVSQDLTWSFIQNAPTYTLFTVIGFLPYRMFENLSYVRSTRSMDYVRTIPKNLYLFQMT